MSNSDSSLSDLGRPLLDLPADRLFERVDGGEVKLRRLGCERLRFWRVAMPSAELELLDFQDERGARLFLKDLAGDERSSSTPGDEGYSGSNVLYFRRASAVVRLVADGPTEVRSLRNVANALDHALTTGKIPN